MNWFDLNFFQSGRFEEVCARLEERIRMGAQILPEPADILNAFHWTPLEQVRVVILGQDPYHTPGYAHGLAFSVLPEADPLPPSLVNIFREMTTDIGGCPRNGYLRHWAEQGVCLLNSSLTVEAHLPGCHQGWWTGLVNEAVQTINQQDRRIRWILWGRHAQMKSVYVNRQKHFVHESVHPSPLAAHRGFFGSKPFSRVNADMIDYGEKPIDWIANA